MSLLQPIIRTPSTSQAILLLVAIVLLATVATFMFSGQTVLSFDTTPNLMLPEWDW